MKDKKNEINIEKKNKRQKNGAFTLIELLAVIIILGVLMIIAIPAVTKYINDSRKSGYVNTAKSIAGGARALVHSGNLDFTDPDTTYYIDAECIDTDNAYKSPYGDFVKAYVAITATNDNYEYFWTSVDNTGTGVRTLININELDEGNIESNVNTEEITTDMGIDERSKIVVVDNNCQKGSSINRTGPKINSATGEKTFMCKKATTLHTKTCARTTVGCAETIGKGNTIIYGTIPSGTPKAGDAYDCDVDNDGTYDSVTERFYYLISENDNSTLIHYSNINNQTKYPYDLSNESWHGPRDGYHALPSINEWSNPGLIAPGVRQIVSKTNTTTVAGNTIEIFDYQDKAARLLTAQEVIQSCPGMSTVGNYVVGELDGCIWLLENITNYEDENSIRTYGYWMETPAFARYVWDVAGVNRYINDAVANNDFSCGIRPVITVKTSNIEK